MTSHTHLRMEQLRDTQEITISTLVGTASIRMVHTSVLPSELTRELSL